MLQADILTVRKPVAAMSEHELQNGKADHYEDDEEVPVFVSPGEPGVRTIFSVFTALLKLGDPYRTSC